MCLNELADKLKDTIMLKEAKSVIQITEPLSKLIGIDYFGMIRIYRDDTHCTLVTLPTWIKQFYKKYFHHGICHKGFNTYKTGFFFQEENSDQTTIKVMKQDFNINPAFTIAKRRNDYCDLYSFASSKHNTTMSFYIKNLDVFYNFIDYFNEKAKPILIEAEQDRKILPKLLKEDKKAAIHSEKTFRKIFTLIGSFKETKTCEVKKFKQLTDRELECVYHISQGHTHEEVSCKLCISKRTVETHLSHAKEKLDTKNITHLIAKILTSF